MTQERYVLVTPAKNEERLIGNTIEAILSQTVLPQRWAIVSDGSTDGTDAIVSSYVQKHSFIQLVRHRASEKEAGKNFRSKVEAFRLGYGELRETPHEFVGNLDADVTFAPDYFQQILRRFQANQRLGIAGGIICELSENEFVPQRISLNSVAGAVQLFRRQTYEAIGGYIPLEKGGIDAAAEITARKHGWQVQTFPELRVHHYRRVSTGGTSVLSTKFRQGMTNYALGYDPLFHLLSSLSKCFGRPYVLAGMAMLLGYTWAFVGRSKRAMPNHLVKFLRSEQRARIISSLTFGSVNLGSQETVPVGGVDHQLESSTNMESERRLAENRLVKDQGAAARR